MSDVGRGLPSYHDLSGPDASGIAAQVEAQRSRVRDRLAAVRHVVAIASGKGGVGKSFVAAGLAAGLARRGIGVGLLDADVNGPTAPRLAGVGRPPVRLEDGAVQPALSPDGVRVYSPEFLVAPGEPVRWRGPEGDQFVWRGALEAGALREMLSDVAWGPLDLLLVDLPPGPGRLADLGGLVPGLRGVVAVTIPSLESHDAVRRALMLAREQGTPILGIVENLTAHACPSCGNEHRVFEGDAGERLAAEFGAELLARIPFHPDPDALGALADRLWSRIP